MKDNDLNILKEAIMEIMLELDVFADESIIEFIEFISESETKKKTNIEDCIDISIENNRIFSSLDVPGLFTVPRRDITDKAILDIRRKGKKEIIEHTKKMIQKSLENDFTSKTKNKAEDSDLEENKNMN